MHRSMIPDIVFNHRLSLNIIAVLNDGGMTWIMSGTRIITDISKIEEQLLRVIEMAKQVLVIVSPYIQITASKSKRWTTLVKAIIDAVRRNVAVTFISRAQDAYNRDDIMKVLAQFREIGCSVFLLSNLHAKIYYNETIAFVSSMNLYLASTVKNHEIGVIIDDPSDLNTIRNYLEDLVSFNESKSVGGKRVVKTAKAPAGMKDTFFKITKKGREYYHARLEGKYPTRIPISAVDIPLEPGAIYTCKATVQWRTARSGRKKSYLSDITGIAKK